LIANYLPSITIDQIIDSLADFLQPFCPSAQIVRGQENRSAPPASPFVLLTEILQSPLETPTYSNSTDVDVQQADIQGKVRIDIQIDFFGLEAGDFATAVETVYRTPYACAQFPAGIQPLYCSDAHQGPFVTAEEQYEGQWTITASLQYNPALVVPNQSATELSVNILEMIP
jgi:hypothetical protein